MRPNILFISCDQQRWDCVGFNDRYPVKTPNIDRLAREGISFDNSYTPLPTCCPARQALLCGKRPERFGALWNFDQGTPVGHISADAFSWAGSLKDLGYKTGYVGKWHVSPVLTPLDFGYDDYVTEQELRAYQLKNNKGKNFKSGFFGEVSPFPYEDAPTHRNAAHVIELIDKYDGEPWHIKMDFPEPHLPCRPSEPFASMYESVPKWNSFDDTLVNKPMIQRQMRLNWDTESLTWDDLQETARLYYGYISQIDDAIGRVLKHLEEKDLLDNTVIIYTADHGDLCGDRRMMDKHYVMYDEVVRVPLVIRYPKMIEKGIKCSAFVTNMLDLVPTILEMVGASVPDDLDGISLMPYLMQQTSESIRKYAMVTYNGQQFGLYTQRMIRNEKYKYVWNPTDIDELYDMENDPCELCNLSDREEYSEILKELRLDLLAELEAVKDCTVTSKWLRDQLACSRKAK